jgi:predicted outer membrane lipoprotein
MKHRRLSPALWLEVTLAVLTSLAAALTIVTPDWIEVVVDDAPDRHNGSFEWMLVVGLGFAFVACTALAQREWRRLAGVRP